MFPKFFTLEEARAALPCVKDFILTANNELETLAEDLVEANARFERLERRMTAKNISGVSIAGKTKSPRAGRLVTEDDEQAKFEQCTEELARLQDNYLKRLNYWVDKITEQGVILRDLRTGLLDFPAKQGDMEYFLCWRLSDEDIHTWHLINDGFIGRKPLAVLIEYI